MQCAPTSGYAVSQLPTADVVSENFRFAGEELNGPGKRRSARQAAMVNEAAAADMMMGPWW